MDAVAAHQPGANAFLAASPVAGRLGRFQLLKILMRLS